MKGHCNGENAECLFDKGKTLITVFFNISKPPLAGALQSKRSHGSKQ
jgi:hypothetical protein